MIIAALALASASAAPATQEMMPFASAETLASAPRAPKDAAQACAEPITVEIDVTLAPQGKVESVDVSPVECDPGLAVRLTGWITGLPASSFRAVSKRTTFSFRMHFLPQQ